MSGHAAEVLPGGLTRVSFIHSQGSRTFRQTRRSYRAAAGASDGNTSCWPADFLAPHQTAHSVTTI
jgi:hypothetical protein